MNRWINGTLDGQPFMVRIDAIQMVAPNMADENERKGKTLIWVDFEVQPGKNRLSCDTEYVEVIKTLQQYSEMLERRGV